MSTFEFTMARCSQSLANARDARRRMIEHRRVACELSHIEYCIENYIITSDVEDSMEEDDPRGVPYMRPQLTRLNEYLVRLHGSSPMLQNLETPELSFITTACGIQYAETLGAEVDNLMWNCFSADNWRNGKRYDDLANEPHGLVAHLDVYFPKGVGEIVADFVGHDDLNPSIFTAFCWWTELLITVINSPLMTLETAGQLFRFLKERRVEYQEDQCSWGRRIMHVNDEMFRLLAFAFAFTR
jgi:hypothetical protein